MPLKLADAIDIATGVMRTLDHGSDERRAIAGVLGCAIAIRDGLVRTPLHELAVCDKCMAVEPTAREFCRVCGEAMEQ